MNDLENYNRKIDLYSKYYLDASLKMKEIINLVFNFLVDKNIKFEFSDELLQSASWIGIFAPTFYLKNGCSVDFNLRDHFIEVRTLSKEIDSPDGKATLINIKTYWQMIDSPVDKKELHNSILKGTAQKDALTLLE